MTSSPSCTSTRAASATILSGSETLEFLTKKVSSTDGRAYHLYLTAIGRKELDFYNHLSDETVRQIASAATEFDCDIELMNWFRQITGILQRVKL